MRTLVCLVSLALLAAAQSREKNPFQTEAAIAEGRRLYGFYCVFCHGMDGASGRGARLASEYRRHGISDLEVFRVIANGVSGTEMSAHLIPEDDIWKIISFVRTLEASVHARSNACAFETEAAKRGRAIFLGKGGCLSCHSAVLDGRPRGSGRLGPDLTFIGATQARGHLRESLVDPAKQVSARYRTTKVSLNNGSSYQGFLLNEDEYTIHLGPAVLIAWAQPISSRSLLPIASGSLSLRHAGLNPITPFAACEGSA
jgi:putative heme-binding domain-containing protein